MTPLPRYCALLACRRRMRPTSRLERVWWWLPERGVWVCFRCKREGVGVIDSKWIPVKDGDARASAIFSRHYSKHHYKDGRKSTRIVGPGEYLMFLTASCDALFVWRKFMRPSPDGQVGVCCSVFRNEGKELSSSLILEACYWAEQRWPGERQYTYIKPSAIKSVNPGYCFKKAGWQVCGITKVNRLIIMERIPA